MKRFYTIAVIAIAFLFANGFFTTISDINLKNKDELNRYETISRNECVNRRTALKRDMAVVPKTAHEYYAVLGRAYALIGSAQKIMDNGMSNDGRFFDLIRSIPVELQQDVNDYSRYLAPFGGGAEQERALEEFNASGQNPIMQPPARGNTYLAFSWLLFHFVSMPFIFIHYAIRLRKQKCSVWMEVCGNPAFPVWLFLWEIGLFRYPHKVSPLAQLAKARRWATLVLSSALSCFAGTGKVCEQKESAPQHQQYTGAWRHLSFSSGVFSDYLGLDGAVFHPAPVIQSSITASLPCGFYLNLWDSEPLGRRGIVPNFGRENDYTFGWASHVRGISFDASTTYINVVPLTQLPRGDVLLLTLRTGRALKFGKGFSAEPHVLLRQALPVRGSTPNGGFFVFAGSGLSHKIGKADAAANFEVVHDTGAFGFREGFLGRITTGLIWKKPKGISWQFPAVTFGAPLSHTGDGRRTQVSVGAVFSFAPAH